MSNSSSTLQNADSSGRSTAIPRSRLAHFFGVAFTVLTIVFCARFGMNLWLTPDQQGRRLFRRDQFADAAVAFQDPMWQGVAWYRAGEFTKAAQAFLRCDTADGLYNQGNAWLMRGEYTKATDCYSRALAKRPDWPEAIENRDLATARAAMVEQTGGDMGDQTLGADKIVFDKKKNNEGQETRVDGAAALSDQEVQAMKIGSPVVGTQQLEGQNWSVQTHEFALFSQRSGTLVVPEFTTRFSRRDDFTGPINDVQAECPSFSIEIERPPGSEGVPFLITTESMEVSETWDPMPSDSEVGAVFKRTIVQRAAQLPGMAFAPISSDVPDGIRFYAGEATSHDQLERGDFIGERRETVSYLLQRPGTYELPELDFVWWNPKTNKLESKTLPPVQLFVSAANVSVSDAPSRQSRSLLWLLLGLASLVAASLFVFSQRQRIRTWFLALWTLLNPPEQVAARRLQHACRSRNTKAAFAAWSQWICMQGADFVPTPRLEAAVIQLQRSMFGPILTTEWNGDELSDAFLEHRRLKSVRRQGLDHAALPKLNPTS